MKLLAPALFLALALAGSCLAAPVPERPNVDDSSVVEPGGGRVLRQSVVVGAPREQVWALFTTPEGLRKWEAPVVSVDLRVGGLMQASYQPGATLGDDSTIANEILAYVPDQLLVIRNVKTPKGFPWPEAFSRVRTVILLEEAGPGRTRVTVSGVGYGAQDAQLYDFFRKGNAYLLAMIKWTIDGGPKPAGPAH